MILMKWPEKIRNEKVGGSIPLSGTNKINGLRVVVASSAVSCHTQVTVDGTTWQHCPSMDLSFQPVFVLSPFADLTRNATWLLSANAKTRTAK